MTTNGLLQIFLFIAVLVALAKPLGAYMARVYEGERLWGLDRVLGPVERLIYRVCGVRPDEEMDWKVYALAVLMFSAVSMIVLYLQQRTQQWFPFNPQKLGAGTVCNAFVQHHDISATLLEAAHVVLPAEIDGKSFWDVAFAGGAPIRDHVTVGWGTAMTVIDDKWWNALSLTRWKTNRTRDCQRSFVSIRGYSFD